MTNQELLESLGVAPQQQLTTKEKLEKVKLANETLKIWKEFNHAGFSLDQLEDYVNNGIMPYMENPVFPEKKKEESKPQLTFGKTITHKPRQIKQDDGTLRCKICNRTIPTRAYDFEQLDDYRVHFEESHRKLTEDENWFLFYVIYFCKCLYELYITSN